MFVAVAPMLVIAAQVQQELWYIPKSHRVRIGTPEDTALLENHRQDAALHAFVNDDHNQPCMVAADEVRRLGDEIAALDTKIRTTRQKKDLASAVPDYDGVVDAREFLRRLEDEKERVVGMHKEALAKATTVLSRVNRTIGSQMQWLSEVQERAKILDQERANMQISNHGDVLDWGRTQCVVRPHGKPSTSVDGLMTTVDVYDHQVDPVDPVTARSVNEKDTGFFASVGGWHAGSETNNASADGNTSSIGDSHSSHVLVIRSKATFRNGLYVHRVVFDRLQVIMAWDRMFPEDPFGATAQSPLQLLQIAKAPDSGKNAMPLITGAKYMAQFRGVIKSQDQPHWDRLRQKMDSMIRKMGGIAGQGLVKFDGLLDYFMSFGRGLFGLWSSKDQQPADALQDDQATRLQEMVDRAYDSEGPVHYSGSASAYGVTPKWKTAQPQDFFNKQQVRTSSGLSQQVASGLDLDSSGLPFFRKQEAESVLSMMLLNERKEGFVDCVARGQMKQGGTTLEVTGPDSLLWAFSKFKTSIQHVDDSKEGGLQGAPYEFQVTYYTKKAIAENILNNFYPELMASEEL